LYPNFYSFTREEDTDEVQYTFSTGNDIGVVVSFVHNEYDQYLAEFPTLLEHGYSFGFMSKKFSLERSRKDDLVFSTIYQIIEDFVSEDADKTTVLLYHCDTNDGRQECRNKLFSNWEQRVKETNLFKYSVEVEIQKPDDQTLTTYYVGLITFLDNPRIESVKEEFTRFCYYIVQPKNGNCNEVTDQ